MEYDVVGVAMSATRDTYEYDVMAFDGMVLTTRTYTLADVRKMYPTCRNEVDALAWVNAHKIELAQQD